MKYSFNFLLATAACIISSFTIHAQKSGYHVSKTFHIASSGGWDYLAVNGGELYVSHGDHVNILNKRTGDSIGIISNTTGVHGIAFIPSLNKGYISNGKLNTVTVFELSTHKTLLQIPVGENPDAIMYDAYTKRIITCNGRSNNLSLIDPATDKVTQTIAVGGKPETAVGDDRGRLYVNIEDRNEIVQVSLADNKMQRWPLSPAEGPTGLAFDRDTKRLFAGCDQLLAVIDATSGKLIDKITIGNGCDGVAFDDSTKTIFASNGDGTLTVIKELSADKYAVQENVATKKGARTIALDKETHIVYLPTADFGKASAQQTRPPVVPGTFEVLVLSR